MSLSLSACLAPGQDQQEAAWQVLFDGETFQGWVNAQGEPVEKGWEVKDGVLHRVSKGGSIFTEQTYKDFELSFEWKIAPGGNSGVKYRLYRLDEGGWLGPEYQVLDDDGYDDLKPSQYTGALYDIMVAEPANLIRPDGQYNESRIVAEGSRIEHWLNGTKVVDIDMDSAAWHERFAASKYSKHAGAEQWFAREAGPIMLQDHGDEVWYRNIRIRVRDERPATP